MNPRCGRGGGVAARGAVRGSAGQAMAGNMKPAVCTSLLNLLTAAHTCGDSEIVGGVTAGHLAGHVANPPATLLA